MRRICFATFELAPFTGGGIGTWLGNTLEAYCDTNAQIEVLFYGRQTISQAEFGAIYPSVILHVLDCGRSETNLLSPDQPGRPAFHSEKMWESYIIMRKLEQLERDTGAYDVVEFVDWSGPGFFAIQQKRLGASFQATELVVRLHGSEGVLRQFETRPWGYQNLVQADIEHQAIILADYCVSHLEANARHYQSIYGLSEHWLKSCQIELPPVKTAFQATTTVAATSETSLCFSSKFQGVKRPGLFVAAAAEFLNSEPSFQGSVVFAAFIADHNEVEDAEDKVPPELRTRITFATSANPDLRNSLIRQNVVVFPNAFETFCFAAYEASLMGAIVVLNERNSAFGPGTPWIDGRNCLKFDGSVAGLTSLLRRIFSAEETAKPSAALAPITYEHAVTPYWLGRRNALPAAPPITRHAPPPLSIVIPTREHPGQLLAQIQALATPMSKDWEIIVVDRGSRDPATTHLLDTMETLPALDIHPLGTLKIVRCTQASNFAMCANRGIAEASCENIAVLPNRQGDYSEFALNATRAIASGSCDVVVPTIRVTDEFDGPAADTFWIPYGSAYRTGLFVNRISPGAFVARRRDLETQRYDEALEGEWTWDLLLRLAYSDHRIMVDTDRGIHIRREDFDHWTSPPELKRRRQVEAVRRNAWRIPRRLDLPWTALGDGELTTAEWHFEPRDVARIKEELEETRMSLETLASARTVRATLRIGKLIKRLAGLQA